MQSHRLARLLRLIVEMRTTPQRPSEQIAGGLKISLRQFYYDRADLAGMGFRFDRRKGRFELIDDPAVTIGDFPLSEVLALVLAARHLFATKDFSIVYRTLNSLNIMLDHMQEPQKGFLKVLVEDVIVRDGFGCTPEILEEVIRAVEEKRRVFVRFHPAVKKRPVALDPFALCLGKSKLFLDAYAVEQKKRKRYALATMQEIVFTPFYVPEDARVPTV
jgi:predicted DNA-binding transcriptional regulator YafY